MSEHDKERDSEERVEDLDVGEEADDVTGGRIIRSSDPQEGGEFA
jgi:hypothetical protein